MAAPTDPRVEANSLSTTTLYWVYGGSAQISVHRSTDGSIYSEVTAVGSRVPVGTLTYIDTGLSAGTKYWYKLSDDGGSSFSSVVTVWTHGCVTVATGGDGFSLPRFGDESQPAPAAIDESGGGAQMAVDMMVEQQAKLDEMARRIEDTLQGRLLDPQECAVCPEDGAIVVNCSDGCRDFVVVADADINSISIQMCDEGEGNIEFIIPPNSTRQICGWPSGFGFGGDECFRAPIVTGSAGRSMNVPFGGGGRGGSRGAPKSRPGYGKGVGRGGMGGTACTCVPGTVGQLTIKSCNPNNSLKCGTTKSGEFVACGGKGPYTWSKTGTIELSRTTGERVSVTPPANSGSGVGGTAYILYGGQCQNNGSVAIDCGSQFQIAAFAGPFGCNDQALAACGSVFTKLCPCNGDCLTNPITLGANGCSNITPCANGGQCNTMCDARSGAMISAGCSPCGVAAGGATVTVTDALGVQTTIILKA